MSEPEWGPLVDPAELPDWLAGMVAGMRSVNLGAFRRVGPAPATARPASVLMLFGTGPDGPDLLLLRRADTLGSHPGQVAFPGGGADPQDDGPVQTALREAEEEVGLRVDGVRPVALLPPLYVPVSGFQVTPVLAHWDRPSPVRAVDPAETAAVARVPISVLTDPDTRIMVRHPSGFISPGYLLPGMLVWGFTAGLVTMLLSAGGWDRPWNTHDVRDLDQALRAAAGTVPATSGEDAGADEEAS
jgi:8-oxo-dGTP pyrophosphatase MutT (NUDIX family)